MPSFHECPAVVRVYSNEIPEFAETALDTLYGSLYSSLPQLRLSSLQDVQTYASWQAGELRAMFLYVSRGQEIRVVNEGMQVDESDTSEFARAMFDRHPDAERVHFRAVQCCRWPPALPNARFTLTEDMVIELPNSEEAYVASLGKSTRKSLRQNIARAKGIAHRLIPGREVDAALVREIIGFNHARMALKLRESALDEAAIRKLMALMRARGMVGAVTLEGKLCAGTLACLIGNDMYSLVNSHDPQYDPLGMGTIGRHLMILAAIREGAQRFHLMGGNIASKRSALASRIPLDDLLIYRNEFALWRHGPGLAALQLAAWEHQLRSAMEDEETARCAGRAMRSALAFARWLKEIRRGKRRPAPGPARVSS